MSITSKIDKAVTLLKFVHRIKDILNKNPDFIKSTEGIDYKYYIKIVDNTNQEIGKFTIGLKNGQMELNPTYKPDVIMTMTENSFFGIIRGTTTLEESYFLGDADIWTADGNWSVHLPGLKTTFDRIQDSVRKELGEI